MLGVWESRIGKGREESVFGNPKLHAFGEPPSSTRSCSSRDSTIPFFSLSFSNSSTIIFNLFFQVLSLNTTHPNPLLDFFSFISRSTIINQIYAYVCVRLCVCVCVRERERDDVHNEVEFGLELEVCILVLVSVYVTRFVSLI